MARIAIVIDLALLWILWPRIARGDTVGIGWSGFRRSKVLASLLASALTVLLVVTIATFPGEWLEEKLPPVRFIPTSWKAWTLPSGQAIQSVGSGWVTLHGLLVAGEVNYVTGRPRSLWSNVLVLPNFEIDDRVRFEADGKSSISSKPLSLRGCSLQGAVLPFADLRRADFTGASLSDAKLFGADLREAKFECDWIGGLPGFHPFGEVENKDRICTQLNGALLVNAQLQGASLDRAQLHNAFLANAQLQGANLDNAGLQGDQLWFAHLQGASLKDTQLQGASLEYAQLRGAFLYQTQLQGAVLYRAQLQGALLIATQLQGAWLFETQLQGASLRRTFVWRSDPRSANTEDTFVDAPELGPKYFRLNCRRPDEEKAVTPADECDWSETSYAALKSLIENSVAFGVTRDRALQRIGKLEKPPYAADEGSTKSWTDLARGSAHSEDAYFNTHAKTLEEIGCAANGAPYVIAGLIPQLDRRFERNLSQEAEVADAFLKEEKCPGARGLSEENKAKLREIRDRVIPASPPLTGGLATRRANHRIPHFKSPVILAASVHLLSGGSSTPRTTHIGGITHLEVTEPEAHPLAT